MYNTGQTAVFLKDLTGREYPAIAEVNRKKRVNGQREISLSFLYTEINKDFMDDLEFGWKVLFKGEWYTITHPGYSTDGNYFAINVTAILSFFVDLNGYFMQDKTENKSITPAAYFGNLFQGTPFSYVLVDNLTANTVSYQDNESRTARFLYGIERFSAEYTVRGNVVYIYKLVGSDKDVILHEDLNINSVRMEVDASGFHTWAKGFGDLPEQGEGEEEPQYQLEVEYRSPLIDKYGPIEGPAIKDGNYKLADALTEAVKNQVENSYIISSEIDAIDLTNNGYPEMVLEEGDRVWLYVDRLKLNQQVRVVEIDETFDWEGNIIAARYTAGNEGIATRYKSDQYDTIDDFDDIISGRKPIEYDWLPDAIKRASEIINGNQDSLFRYLPGEIIGINQSNPNEYMRFNTDGIGFSRDGGKTYKSAITYEGVVAESIVGGSIIGVNISSFDEKGMFHVNGADAEFLDLINNRSVKISPDGIFGYNTDDSERFRMDRLLVTSAALGTSNSNVYLAPDSTNEVRVVDISSIPSDGVAENYSYRPIRVLGVRFAPGGNGYLGTEGEIRVTSSGFVQEGGSVIYRDLRAATLHGYGFSTITTNAYLGSDDETRFVNKGYIDGSTEQPIYRSARGHIGFFDGIGNNVGTNLYLGTNSEVYVTSLGMATQNPIVWRPIRALGVHANYIDVNGATEGTHLYLRPAGGGGVAKVTARGTIDTYADIYYKTAYPQSQASSKTNIHEWDTDGVISLGLLKDLNVRTYHYQSSIDEGNFSEAKIGMLAEELPIYFRNAEATGADPYSVVSFLVRICQIQQSSIEANIQQITTLRLNVADLEQLIGTLYEQMNILEQRISELEMVA